jgi:hypothetical protein
MILRSKVIAALVTVVALTGAAAGVASATSGSSTTTTRVEHYWLGNIDQTGAATVFVGTGVFTDAGSISPEGVVTGFWGSFSLINERLRYKDTINMNTCFVTQIISGGSSVGRGTGAYKGISGTLSVRGEIVAVLRRLKNGECDVTGWEDHDVVPLNQTGELSGSSKITLRSVVP